VTLRATTLMAAVLLAGPALAQEVPAHSQFDGVLVHVRHDGLVDYAALRADRATLDAYIAQLGAADSLALAAASRDVRLAFWINAYNACALLLVVDHYPIKKRGFPTSLVRSLQGVPGNSIRQIRDTWDRRFCSVAGKARSLDEIEHRIIRPMGEPRIHFAVNCASRSCPALATRAYRADSLDQQLDQAAHRFVTDDRHLRLVRGDEPPTLLVNAVLDWYGADFGGSDGVREFLLTYLGPEDAQFVRQRGVVIEFLPYDWTLNDTAVFGAAP